VGVGWHGGHCFVCDACRRGDFINCKVEKITAIHFDGGYAEYMIANAEAVASMPDDLTADEAAPLLCAGITVFNALRNSGARAGDLVAVQGIGGLGHLGVQYARQMGFHTVAIGRGADKEALARKLGAHSYVDTTADSAAQALQKMGGAQVVLATAPDSKSMSAVVGGLAPRGTLMVVGADMEALSVTPVQLIFGSKNIRGWASGAAIDWEDTLQFSALTGVRPMIERYPLEKAAEAYNQMLSGRARFRVVLTMS
jgi:D-arabinose 1-dehydrogenase-like Zn-dependent alcohol dehydrogenase